MYVVLYLYHDILRTLGLVINGLPFSGTEKLKQVVRVTEALVNSLQILVAKT